MPHKQIDVAIAAFNAAAAGRWSWSATGPTRAVCGGSAGPTIQFAGRLTDAAVADILQSARALIVTAVEEFGIAAVECAGRRPSGDRAARAAGRSRPIVDGVTGCFFSGGADELRRGGRELRRRRGRPRRCVRNAARFDAASFRRGI